MNKYTIQVLVGFLLWSVSTAYFGWNDTPVNNFEKTTDIISIILIFWGVIGDVLMNVTWKKSINISVVKEDLKDTIQLI